MKNLVLVVVLLLVGIAGLGFYRGWFQVSTDTANPSPSATITVDEGKFHEDEQRAKERVSGLEQEAKAKVGDRAGKVKEPERRP